MMTWGPTPKAIAFARAVIGGQQFAAAIKQKGRSKSCIVMVRGAPPRSTQIGEVQRFYKFRPPWVRPEPYAHILNLADVRWFKVTGHNRKLDSAPEVSKAYWEDPAGNLRWCESIIPTPVGLVPTLDGREETWQVMHIDPDFCSRLY